MPPLTSVAGYSVHCRPRYVRYEDGPCLPPQLLEGSQVARSEER